MKKKQQQQLMIILLVCALGYYFMIYLPGEEKKKENKQKQQAKNDKSEEELKAEQEADAWDKGRIWELETHSWADRIVKSKSASLTGQYQKMAGLFTDGDRNPKFYFSRAAPYRIYFPPALREYYEKGKESGDEKFRDKLFVLEEEEELILSDEINSWIDETVKDPTKGKVDKDSRGNNALFYGTEGTGKTATMKNVCIKSNVYPLVEIKGSNLTPTESDQSAEILPLQKFAYTLSELEWNLVKECGFEREENGEVRYILFVDEANQISNNSGFFQPNQLRFLKDCMEGIDQKEVSNNLWVFATNHLDQVEKATYRKGRLSNPLDFSWTWAEFVKHAERAGVYEQFPERWKETKGLWNPEDDKWISGFNIDIFKKDFLGDDPSQPTKPRFWDLFIENNPDAQIETEEDEKDEDGDPTGNKVKIDIEIGEFLEFFWAVKKRNIMSYDGSYESIQKETVEKVLDTRLSDMIELIEDKLNELIDEVNKSRTEGKEQIMDGIDRIINNLANR